MVDCVFSTGTCFALRLFAATDAVAVPVICKTPIVSCHNMRSSLARCDWMRIIAVVIAVASVLTDLSEFTGTPFPFHG